MSWKTTAAKCTLAAGAILLSAGCTSKKDVAIAAKDDTIRRQEQEISSAEQERAAADAQARALAEQQKRNIEINHQLAQQNDQLANRVVQTASAMNENTNRLAQVQSELVTVEGKINGINSGKTIVVTQPGMPVNEGQTGNISRDSRGSIHIQVAGSVLFESGHAELKASCSDTLMRIAQTIRAQYPHNAIRIEGHTDSTPVVHSRDKYPDNMALSQARAAAVYDFMVKRGGLSAGHIYTAGYGDRQPLVTPERTPGDRAKNRRVEIVILPNNLKVQKDQMATVDGAAHPFQTGATETTTK